MTLPSPLRELAAGIRPDNTSPTTYAVSNAQLTAWADKLESLAGEYAVVPREPTEAMILANGTSDVPEGADWLRRDAIQTWTAMIEAAERQGKP